MTRKIAMTCGLIGLILVLVSAPALAQNGEPDYQATADAADQAARDARWRAQSAQATADAAHVTATARAQATATAQVEAARATATAQSVQATATVRAQEWTATARAWDDQATAQAATREAAGWATDATATAGAYQARATSQALQIEREQAERDAAKAWRPVRVYGGWLALIILVAAAIWVSEQLLNIWERKRRAQVLAEFEASVIDADPVSPHRRPVALIPPETGWTPAYLRPIETRERQGRPA